LAQPEKGGQNNLTPAISEFLGSLHRTRLTPMSTYVLHYWPIKARVLANVIAAQGGLNLDFRPTDEAGGEQWPDFKPRCVFGQLPHLVVKDESGAEVLKVSQSMAIARYLVCLLFLVILSRYFFGIY
jgi:hypothetical protein